jgi:hypothetical protein
VIFLKILTAILVVAVLVWRLWCKVKRDNPYI